MFQLGEPRCVLCLLTSSASGPLEYTESTKSDAYEIAVIESMGQLNRITIEEIQEAKVVIVASNLFQSKGYVERLGMLAGKLMPPPTVNGSGRHYRARLDQALEALRREITRLMGDDGAAGVWSKVKAGQLRGSDVDDVLVQDKRVQGQKYRDAHAQDSTAELMKNEKKGKPRSTHTFATVNTITVFLNVHLGSNDASELKVPGRGKSKNEQTSVEKFHSFREVHSAAWDTRRHEKAQEFLNHFVRQNIAEIDEIPCEKSLKLVTLPAAERALYFELSSSSAEEARLKRCSHFDLDMEGISLDKPHKKVGKKGKKNSPQDSDEESEADSDAAAEDDDKDADSDVVIVTPGLRRHHARLDRAAVECKQDLKAKIKEAVALEVKIGHIKKHGPFRVWIRGCQERRVNDTDASSFIRKIIREATSKQSPATPNGKLTTRDPKRYDFPIVLPEGISGGTEPEQQSSKTAKSTKKENMATKKSKKAEDDDYRDDDDDDDDENGGAQKKKSAVDLHDEPKWDLREQTHFIRRLEKDIVDMV
ncbi:hypothetical protein CALCODRAFT_513440 [Calocera cornea HHB12733]|uniref:Uncharacterized protein n=1 Tax=Calocera cornea HHB12733 TaxID=1353952 RepID=A0A165C3E4_9BASI|nr:hypothetical protein CALCODRAFT_513440 [Calocera cornea HHB12733]